jgi:hypothetical protein
MITNGIIRCSDGGGESSDGVGVGGDSRDMSIAFSASVSVAAGEATVAAVVVARNRYMSKYVKAEPDPSPELTSESFLRARANCVLPCLSALRNPSKLPSGASAESSLVSAKSALKSCNCVVVVSVEPTRDAASAAPATYRNRESISA